MFAAVVPLLLQYTGDWRIWCANLLRRMGHGEKVEDFCDTTTTMLRCNMYNSTYLTDKFTDGNRRVDVEVTDISEPRSHSLNHRRYQPVREGNRRLALDLARNPDQPRSCTFNTDLMRHVSYQANMDTPEQLITDRGEIGAAG